MTPLAKAARSGDDLWPVHSTVAGVVDVSAAAVAWAILAGGLDTAPSAHPTASRIRSLALATTGAGRSEYVRRCENVAICSVSRSMGPLPLVSAPTSSARPGSSLSLCSAPSWAPDSEAACRVRLAGSGERGPQHLR